VPASLSGNNAYRVIDPSPDATSVTCDIEFERGKKIDGTVVGPDGKPLSGARVTDLAGFFSEAKTLDTAAFSVTALDLRDTRELFFLHPERKLAGTIVVRGDEPAAPKVRLQPWGTLTGRVTDGEGKPRAGVQVRLAYEKNDTNIYDVLWMKLPHDRQIL